MMGAKPSEAGGGPLVLGFSSRIRIRGVCQSQKERISRNLGFVHPNMMPPADKMGPLEHDDLIVLKLASLVQNLS
jgi:hypothetical protein